MNSLTVICPHCQNPIAIDEALAHQFEETNKQALEEKLAEDKVKLRKQMEEWQKEQQEKLQKAAQESAQKELEEARKMELELRKQKNELDEQMRKLELEKQRQIDEEREKIRKETAESLLERHRLMDAERMKQIEDMKKTIEELQLKANQGSQQLQGEVLELELENELRLMFPNDEIIPVGKGINGADIVQKVHDSQGRVCGTIIWESKRTKHWTDGWVQKLKEDMLRAKGDVAVLVTIALPDGVKNFGYKEGIYVTTFDCFLSLAQLLRRTLVDHNAVKLSVVGKNEKMEMVYNYFLSSEFRQRVEIIAEAFSAMRLDLDNEKKVMAKIWAKREKEIERVVLNTSSMHGELQGLIGTALPKVDSLEMDSLMVGFEES